MVELKKETAGGVIGKNEYELAHRTPMVLGVENRSEIRGIGLGSGVAYPGEYSDGEVVIEWSRRACGDTSPAERGVVESLLSLPGIGKVRGSDYMKKTYVGKREESGDAGGDKDDVLPSGVNLAYAVEMEANNGEDVSLISGTEAEDGEGGGKNEGTEVKKEEYSVMNVIKDDDDGVATTTTVEEVVEEDNEEDEEGDEGGESSLKEGGKRKVAAPWTAEEDALLASLVSGFVHNKRWACLSRKMPGRNGKQCRERWNNHLDPGVKTGPFSTEEDCLIVKLQGKFGNKWAKIRASMPKRGDNSIKNRWNSSLKKKVEKLRQEYRKNRSSARNPGLKLEVIQTILESEDIPSDVAKKSAEQMYCEYIEFQEVKRHRVHLMTQQNRMCLLEQRSRQKNRGNASPAPANTAVFHIDYNSSTPKRKHLSSGVRSDKYSDKQHQQEHINMGVESQLSITPCKGGGGISDAPTEGFSSPETTPGSDSPRYRHLSDCWSSHKRKSSLFGDELSPPTIIPSLRQRRKNASSSSRLSLEKDINGADDVVGCGLSALEAESILSLSMLSRAAAW